ncbi:metalloregulator ArsR/SmtB family transcription factor [bacterium]|nr:metalloregulator ArsR/SmtB family transcription factor [bacterium]
MVKYSESALDTTFSALADPIRREILGRLTQGAASVSELARPFSISMPAVMKHLSYLEKAGLVAGEKKGRVHKFQLVAAPMQDAAEWIAGYKRFWEKQFESLAKYLDSQSKEESSSWKQRQDKRQRSRSSATSTRQEKKSTKRGRTQEH